MCVCSMVLPGAMLVGGREWWHSPVTAGQASVGKGGREWGFCFGLQGAGTLRMSRQCGCLTVHPRMPR
jgi:hypothetical protein